MLGEGAGPSWSPPLFLDSTKGKDAIDLETAMNNMKLRDGELADVFVGEVFFKLSKASRCLMYLSFFVKALCIYPHMKI